MTKGLKIGLITGGILLIGGISFAIYKLRSHTSDAHLSAIPKNAAVVLKIDIKALAVKADPMKLAQLPGFKKSGSAKSSLEDLIADPFSTGIDPIENVYGFVAAEGTNTVAGIVFNVDDAKKLQEFENKLHIGTEETTVEAGIYYSPLSERECIAWNDDAGMIISVKDGEAKMIAMKYLSESRDNCITANPDFETFSDKSFDLGIFFNNKELSKMSGTEKSLASLGMSDGHAEILMTFENDKISAAYSNYSAGQNTSVLKKTGPGAKQFNAIAPATPLIYLGMAADMDALFTVMKNDTYLSDDLAGIEMGMGINENDLKKLFSGDISVSFTDFKDISNYDPRIKASVDKMMQASPDADRSDYALNTPMCYVSIGETDDVRMKNMLANSGMMKVDSFYAMPGLSYILYTAANDGHMLITNDYYAAQELSHTGKLSATISPEISRTDAFSFYTDLNQAHFPPSLTSTCKEMLGDEQFQLYLSVLHPFQSIRVSGKENASQLEIAVEPGEGNSLYRILAYYSTLMN